MRRPRLPGLRVLFAALALTGSIAGCARTVPCVAGRPASALSPVVADPGFLEQVAATLRFRLGQPKGFVITPSGERVLFLRSRPRSFSHDLYSLETRTAAGILKGGDETISAEERARRERMQAHEELRRIGRGVEQLGRCLPGDRPPLHNLRSDYSPRPFCSAPATQPPE